jgi:amino acid transporter
MGFGAFSGLEYMAIFAGEAKDPGAAIRRSSLVSAPVVVAMFALGTAAVTAFLAPDEVDLIAPIPQTISLGTHGLGPLAHVLPVVIVALAAGQIAWGSATFSGIARLPLVAGWDGLLPRWFTRLHARWRTPTSSILFVTVVTLVVGAAAMVGVGNQEAFQLLGNAALIFYALTYLVMFSIPVFARTGASWWVQALAVSGFLTTLLFVVLSIFPIIEVESTRAFSTKIIGTVVGANALGVALFFVAKRRRSVRPPAPGSPPVRTD